MKEFYLNEQQFTQATNIISDVVLKTSKDKNVDCIYMITKQERDLPIIKIMTVYSGNENLSDSDEYWDKKVEEAKTSQIDICFDKNNASNYDSLLLTDDSIHACHELVHSTILFDKMGLYSNLKSTLSNQKMMKYPLEDNLQMKQKR